MILVNLLCHKALLAGGLIQTPKVRLYFRKVAGGHKALLAGGLIQTHKGVDY